MRILTILFLLSAAVSWGGEQPPDKEKAQEIFGKFKAMNGTWQESSSVGWHGQTEVRVIARGSAVLSTSRFQDEPEEGMADVYYMDGDRLLLTHYCEAGNQPTLVATEITGNRVRFTFDRGTNMVSRDVGHMDEVVYIFHDAHHFTSQWSWYKDGKGKLFEEVTSRRIK
jgi:hypothetical protein